MNKPQQIVVVVVVAAGVIAAGFFAGDHQGRSMGSKARSHANPRLRIEKLTASAVEDEATAALLKPQNGTLEASIKALELKHEGLLDKLREAREVRCSPADGSFAFRFTQPAPSDAVDALAEVLRAAVLKTLQESVESEGPPTVAVDVIDFAEVTGGPCRGARIVGTTFTSKWIDFEQNCGKEGPGVCDESEPKPTYYDDDTWGCVRVSRTEQKSLADDDDCEVVPAESPETPETPMSERTSLYWLARGKEIIYLSAMAGEWPALPANEVAPAQSSERELGVALRFDQATRFEIPILPVAVSDPADDEHRLERKGSEPEIHTGAEEADVLWRSDGLVVVKSAGYRALAPDGFAQTYAPAFDLPEIKQTTLKDSLTGKIAFGDEHHCTSSNVDKGTLVEVGAIGKRPVFIEGKVIPGPQQFVFWESPFGDMYRCANRDLAPWPRDIPAEKDWESLMTDEQREACQMAEPLIYLYPTRAIDVDVRLSPAVTLTAARPDYGHDGWKVHAEPSGQLRNLSSGLKLDAIFWEGWSDVVAVPSSGTVLARHDVDAFLRSALPRLGLSPKEARDFRKYWQPKLERPAFVLVRFLDPAEIDALAPLEIVPPADAVIRVMLDFWPLQRRIDVPPQRWPEAVPKRTGFVAVEWGGLLRKATLSSIAPLALNGAPRLMNGGAE
ncbi:MAG: hypothetical protein Q8O67_09375 [Deltaproteobacteria bacterium]|nr:hypothetical protein [Deltaproteobacteria bacterium]